jgi:4-oxalmesaconate hydratase
MVGAVRGIDPETGHYFDDTKRYLDALALAPADLHKVYEGNARRVFPRLNSASRSRQARCGSTSFGKSMLRTSTLPGPR